jgi:low temperature requirement protein LtrA
MAVNRRHITATLTRPPTVYAAESESTRHATWLELFFDLVFVVALAALGHQLHHHLDLTGAVEFAALFALVWWIWLTFSYYADTYDTESTLSRVAMVAVMFVVIFLAETIPDALAGGSFAFGVGVFVLRAILGGLHLRARRMETDARPFVAYWIALEVLVTLVWGLSLLVPEPGRFGLWLAALLLSSAGITAVYLSFDRIEAQVSHFNERLGLFTILVLGETVLAVAAETSITEWGVRAVLVGVAGFAVVVAVWWLYFAPFDDGVVDRALRASGDGWLEARQRGIVHVFAHYPVHAGIVAAGVGIGVATETALAGHALGTDGRLALTGGVAVFLVGSSVAHRVAPGCLSPGTFRARLVGAAVIGVLGLVAAEVSALALLGLTAAVLVGLIGYESLDATPETTDAGTDPRPREAADAATGGRVEHEWAPSADGRSRRQDHADLAD